LNSRVVGQAERFGDTLVRDLAGEHVGRGAEHRIKGGLRGPHAGELLRPRAGRVGQAERRGARHGAGHVGDAVVHDAVDDVGRVGVRGRLAGLDATALVDGDVDDHRAFLHRLQVFAADQPRRARALDQHGADHQVGVHDLLADRDRRAVQQGHVRRHHVAEVAQAVEVDVEQAHVGAEARRHLRRVGADHATAEDHHGRRFDARHTAEQDAAPAIVLLEADRADLHRHAAGDFAHRRQQRQRVAVDQRLVGEAVRARLQHRVGQLARRREVEVGEQQLALLDQRILGGQRLLHLHDHLGLENTSAAVATIFAPAAA
jgi:hypothetical protein